MIKEEEIENELDENELKIPRYAGRVKAIAKKGEKNTPKEAEIGVWIDTYDDIFSDFDSRPFSQRALSDDFLLEMKRSSRDKPAGGIELKIFTPASIRSFAQESMINRRLQEHFRKHHARLHMEIGKIKRRGILLTILGLLMITLAAYISTLSFEGFFATLLVVALEPTGWFAAWTGLEHIFYRWEQLKPDLEFYEKMANAEIIFTSY